MNLEYPARHQDTENTRFLDPPLTTDIVIHTFMFNMTIAYMCIAMSSGADGSLTVLGSHVMGCRVMRIIRCGE